MDRLCDCDIYHASWHFSTQRWRSHVSMIQLESEHIYFAIETFSGPVNLIHYGDMLMIPLPNPNLQNFDSISPTVMSEVSWILEWAPVIPLTMITTMSPHVGFLYYIIPVFSLISDTFLLLIPPSVVLSITCSLSSVSGGVLPSGTLGSSPRGCLLQVTKRSEGRLHVPGNEIVYNSFY